MKPNRQTDIPFHIPFISGEEGKYLKEAIARREFSGGGYFTEKCEQWLEQFTSAHRVLLTSSCTHALEMCALLCDIQPGDEVIMPSFNFVSAANAFVLRGARIVFVDIRPDTMNLDERLLEPAITIRTKAIVVVHYGGQACEMDTIMAIANRRSIMVIEDAAHCIGAYYKDRHLGTIGHLGTISFHASKNIHCGEGGALVVNEPALIEKADIIRDKGTNRKAFLGGFVEKYSWVNLGSSYTLSELQAAFLFGQLTYTNEVITFLSSICNEYSVRLSKLESALMPTTMSSNGHIFFIKCKDGLHRQRLAAYLNAHGIIAHFHYVPLHTSSAGVNFGNFHGKDNHTTKESNRLIRLPLYFGINKDQIGHVVSKVLEYYANE